MRNKQWFSDSKFGFFLSIPIIIIVVGLLIYPMIDVIRLSFTNQKISGSSYEYVGFLNYIDLIADDRFNKVVLTTFYWVIGNAFIQTMLGFTMALLLFYTLRKIKFALPMFIIPWIIPTAVMALLWRWMLDATNGIIGKFPEWLGITEHPFNFIGDPDTALLTLIVVNSWRWFPFIGIIIFAAIQNIPKDIFEAASVEGASFLDELRYIVFPLLSKVLFFMGILGIIFSFNVYDVIALITPKGGPLDSTTTLPFLIHQLAFESYSMSKAATASVYMVLLLIFIISLYFFGAKIISFIIKPTRKLLTALFSRKLQNIAGIMANNQVMKRSSQNVRVRERNPFFNHKNKKSLFNKFRFSWLAAFGLFVFIIGPLFWLVFSSLRLQKDISTGSNIYLTMINYAEVLNKYDYLIFLKNSVIVCAITVIITTLLAVHTAYAINRFEFLGRKVIKHTLLIAYLFPNIVLLVPLFKVMKTLHLIDSLWSLVLINVVLTAPFCTWLLDTYMKNVPKGIEEAAQVEGAGRLTIMYRIVFPMLAPGIGSIVMFTLITSWSEYLFAVSFIMDQGHKTLPAGLAMILSSYDLNWPLRSAAAVMTAIPIVVFFIFLGRPLIQNATEGAIK